MPALLTDQETRRTIGAALFSAAGSVPVHISPLLIATLIASRSLSNAEAGSVISCIMAGQIVAALLATQVRFEKLTRPILTFVFCIYAASIALTVWANSPVFFAACWLTTGLASGFLMQFGMVTAAQSSMKLQAFAWRLAFALFISGLIAISLPLVNAEPSYAQLITLFGLGLLLVYCGGLVLWMRRAATSANTSAPFQDSLTRLDGIGLTLLFLFFAGLIGFLANSVHYTSRNDLDLHSTALAIGLSKGSISLVILWVALRGDRHSRRRQMVYSIALAAAAALIFTQQAFAFVVLAFVAFELFLNLSSAAFMAALSERFTNRARTLLLIAALSGTLSGPPLVGFLIDTGRGSLPLLLAALAAFLPLLWLSVRGLVRDLGRVGS